MSRFMFFWPTDSQDDLDYDEHGNLIGDIPAPFSDQPPELKAAKIIFWVGLTYFLIQLLLYILRLFK